jgi:regulator of replication initiation timing
MNYIDESTQKHIDELVKSLNKVRKENHLLTKENKSLKKQLLIHSVVVPKGTLCETCQDNGQYYAGTLIGYVNCPDCNE